MDRMIEINIRLKQLKDEIPRLEDLIEKMRTTVDNSAPAYLIASESINNLIVNYKKEVIELETEKSRYE